MNVVRLGPEHWHEHRDLRLEALRTAPDAFAMTYAESVGLGAEHWQQWLRGPATFWHARDDSGSLGMAGLWDSPIPRAGTTAQLISMYVRPLARRRGVGQALVRTVADEARARGYERLFLHVTTGNDVAQRLYERTGFVATGETVPHPHQSCLREHVMVRSLV